jgi:Tol biopolymer transport system component
MIRWKGLALLSSIGLAACSGADTVGPTASPLAVVTRGLVERGADVWLSVLRGTDTLTGPTVRWSVDDTTLAIITTRADGTGVLTPRVAGRTVRAIATVNGEKGSRDLPIAAPPSIIVAFRPTATGDQDIYRVALDGTELTVLTPNSPLDDLAPTVLGTRLVFASWRTGQRSLLYSMPLTGGTPTALPGGSVLGAPRIAPTLGGSRLAYISPVLGSDRIWIGTGSGADVLLTDAGATLEGDPALTPDGTRIAYWSTARGQPEVAIIALDRMTVTPVVLGNAAFAPAWRSDGARLLVASNRDTTQFGPTSIYEVTPAPLVVRRLTARAGSDTDPEYLADGRVVYVAFTGSATAELRWLYPDIPGLTGRIPLPAGLPSKPRRLP